MGFRSLRLVSTSYMMKVDWSLRTKRDDLWVRIMRSKYKCGEDLLPIIDRKKNGSNLWKGVCSSWRNFQENLGLNIGDGTKVEFWDDRWGPGSGKLKDSVSCPIPSDILSKHVCHFMDDHVFWNLHQL